MTAVEVLQEWTELEPICPCCHGTGQRAYLLWSQSAPEPEPTDWTCPRCHGTGIEPERSET